MVSVPMNKVMTVLGSDGFTTKYEEYAASNQDSTRQVFAANWMGMSFTPATGHTLNGVKLWLKRTGTIGLVTVSIRAFDGGEPSGVDLSTSTFQGSALPTTAAQKLISMPAVAVAVSTLYTIVLRVADGDASNTLDWDTDDSTPTYAGGSRWDSSNSGNDWTEQTGTDFIFEEWGFA